MKKRLILVLIFIMILFIALIVRIFMIQFIPSSIMDHDLKEEAYRQQMLSKIITPKRGTIYDSTGTRNLAFSVQVETITINPTRIEKENKQKVAGIFAEIFELNYDEVLAKVNSEEALETIIKKIDKEKTDKLRKWMEENDLYTGINIDPDNKRYYPYNNLASNVIGFCGTDGQGLEGIEVSYNNVLKGNVGRVVTITNAAGDAIPNTDERYIKEQNGSDIVLTIDAYIQEIVEEKLKQAVEENACSKGGNVVVMDPKTGDILAMATYPNYNLNSPFESVDMWRNKAITDTYEPGSTFKILTTAVALEENLYETDHVGDLYCAGGEQVEDRYIACWRYFLPHEEESLRVALMNSCNPAFIQIGQKIGVDTFYKYLQAFGIMSETGVNMPGEASGIFFRKSDIGLVELATLSMGQRFELTPLQLITAVSAIANEGNLMQPRIVRQIINPNTNVVQNIEPIKVRQVVSKETSKKVLDLMQSVVDDGTATTGQVAGYAVAGKTGTAEAGITEGTFTASFIGVAPVKAPQVVVLVTLYNPDPYGPNGYQGGAIAAPVSAKIMEQILPYMQ